MAFRYPHSQPLWERLAKSELTLNATTDARIGHARATNVTRPPDECRTTAKNHVDHVSSSSETREHQRNDFHEIFTTGMRDLGR
ncbi:hypothetical protein SNOG_08692 [Parastagonospora nodorum SN15]|uniref:Uncharacterized protein n=1 Tax=Phaeosphaeria nodorum (strain SN15 / ATCC MYA-4574 / FGSC 10173) TaxID=321614 RepID=Q0UHS2_PHANO|nr:hypothetical protein SNOG_08692 [Parastagonospora nodorum SN15]EAT83860.2 hypothetical protein SNOG_08692 [Parastagonospora nodorum SN15]